MLGWIQAAMQQNTISLFPSGNVQESQKNILLGAVPKRRRNFFGRFWYPHVGILTLIYLTSTF